MTTFPIGSVVAGYRVRRIIGAGGMGTIYAVDDPALPRLDALKVLSAELSADPKFRARFIREADVAARLDHPNIVSIYDRGETPDGQLWIAMQFVDGIDADAAIRSGTMTPRRAVHLIAQVADALDYAHAHRVLHRDLKPANFLLTGPAGPDERALLADFGIARAVDDAGLTGTNMVMATMAYAAPEVLSGQQIDYRADLYSLGCALYHLLSGEVPYADTAGGAAQAAAHLRRPPPQVGGPDRALGQAFDSVIATAMAKDPAARFPSGRALAAAARHALQEYELVVTPRSAFGASADGAAAPPRRRRGKLIAFGTAVGVLVAGGVTAGVILGGKDSPTDPSGTGPNIEAVPTVSADELPGLMVSVDEVTAATGVPAKRNGEPLTELVKEGNDSCVGTVFPLQKASYNNSGATDQYGENFADTTPEQRAVTIASVVEFPSPQLADRHVARQRTLWQQCAYKSAGVSGSGGDPGYNWLISAVTPGDIVTSTATVDTNNRTYQHALTSVNNIVVDVLAYVGQKPDAAVTVLRAITKKVPH
ncbi:sensor domain-containing protein [Mycobacterium koreense]|uniref:non-specific serine/threonine protein kinase n=1 Tax=Mycolicibacillus koreensis TaxID=1069220 RepID=A0A7I7SJU3_9MYCO|nr:serine/threonine-protein kinase PknH/PknJ [Mycolicibacillus koreensis]MCV7247338.1 sensor domain-containing protein [Mycolicibacillus koreensis]ODR10593.1 hypothetical protein BHQ15_04060 [Mycolicibacillus koreensis]OSC34413.1 hypothetical protein B8W67_06645 [Mycolicibacillus koreensis]BBY56529.1 serine/threonine-protein kinase PknJ [Mycolicibacillus koreensis]